MVTGGLLGLNTAHQRYFTKNWGQKHYYTWPATHSHLATVIHLASNTQWKHLTLIGQQHYDTWPASQSHLTSNSNTLGQQHLVFKTLNIYSLAGETITLKTGANNTITLGQQQLYTRPAKLDIWNTKLLTLANNTITMKHWHQWEYNTWFNQ